MKHSKLTFGQMEAIVNKLGGIEGAKSFLRDEFSLQKIFPIFMTVKLGTGLETADDFYRALETADYGKGKIYNLLDHPAFRVANQLTEVSIVTPTVAELGFKEDTCYFDICQRGLALGYELCPLELALQLRLQYKDQPNGDYLGVALESIYCEGGSGSDGLLTATLWKHDDDNHKRSVSSGWTSGPSNTLKARFVFISHK